MTPAPVIPEAQAIVDRYRSAVEGRDIEALAALYHPDVLLDAHVPNWRFQVQGRDAVAATIGTALPGPGRFRTFEAEATVSGDLLVRYEWRQDEGGGGHVCRQSQVLRLDDGHIAEQILYCAGVWNRQLQAQMAGAAPLVRP